jgi:hypothetical protein
MTCELTDDLPEEGSRKWWDKKAELEELADTDQVVTVVTVMDVYEEMLITAMTPKHSPGKASYYQFDIVMEKAKFATSTLAAVDPASIPRRIKAKKTTGNQNAEDDTKGKTDGGKVQKTETPQSIIDKLFFGAI